MFNANLIVLSYHQFFAEESEYAFSRTYKQFRADLEKRDFDWITMDDGHIGIIKACKMMQDLNLRAKIFIPTSLVGSSSEYCSWEDLWRLSKFHDIENHSHDHIKLTQETPEVIYDNLFRANEEIRKHIGVKPRFFVPPWNQSNQTVLKVANDLGLQLVNNRINMRNNS